MPDGETTMLRAVPLLLLGLTFAGADEPLTLEQADARFRRAYAIARETNDRKIVERLDLIRDQLKRTLARKDTPGTERLLRDAETEVGIDPGGKSMSGLPIAQIPAALQKKLETLERPFAEALKSNDPAKVRQVVDDFAKLLGDQAGVPDARFKGDQLPVIAVKPADVDSALLKILDSKSPLLQTFVNETPSPT
jgi:hypothetical protein